jgi:hypothetical protein
VEIFFENFLRGENLKRAEKILSSADFITVARVVQKTVGANSLVARGT